jgi:hypothetical protein
MLRFGFDPLRRLAPPLALAAALAGGAAPVRAQARVDDFRVKMEKWVETRQIISEERSEWESEQAMLRSTRDLLRQQKEALQEEIETLDASITEADQERLDLLLARGEYQRSSKALEEEIRGLEQEVLTVAPRLPGPLQKRLDPLLVQIPEDPEQARTSLGQRLINILGVLLQAEKWNGTATFVGETRSVNGDGPKVQVRTLYWGLGQAFYVDAQGESAGIGRPDGDGWTFSEEPGMADEADLLLDIFEGNVDVIQFVKLPVRIQSRAAPRPDRP